MITKWKVFNFKSIRQLTELDMGPLTIFAGANSSGKSAWIQSILLVSQTLASKLSSRSVVLNGSLTQLGQFDDLQHFNDPAPQISIGWECRPVTQRPDSITEDADDTQPYLLYGVERPRRIACDISFEADPAGRDREQAQLNPSLFGCQIVVETNDGFSTLGVKRDKTSILGQKSMDLNIPTPEDEAILAMLGYDVELDSDSVENFQFELGFESALPVGCNWRHFLPDRLAIRYDQNEEEARVLYQALTQGVIARTFGRIYTQIRDMPISPGVVDLLKSSVGRAVSAREETVHLFEDASAPLTLRELRRRIRELSTNSRQEFSLKFQVVEEEDFMDVISREKGTRNGIALDYPPAVLRRGITYLDEFFSRCVKYLGPLRDEPKALYPLATNHDPFDVGIQGENTAAVLHLHRDRRISYLPSALFEPPAVKVEPTIRNLEVAVADWLRYLGVVETFRTDDLGKLGHKLQVTTEGVTRHHDLTHVGVGVSQVLPIVVLCLIAGKDTTLIFEQPELHLHPRVQTRLADFFLSMALLGKQCIIESHSEYLISRLRFRAAAAQSDSLTPKIKLFFVEKKDGASSFREVVVNQYGAIPDWPEGFFDQSQDEAEKILRAATIKRKSERGDRKNG